MAHPYNKIKLKKKFPRGTPTAFRFKSKFFRTADWSLEAPRLRDTFRSFASRACQVFPRWELLALSAPLSTEGGDSRYSALIVPDSRPWGSVKAKCAGLRREWGLGGSAGPFHTAPGLPAGGPAPGQARQGRAARVASGCFRRPLLPVRPQCFTAGTLHVLLFQKPQRNLTGYSPAGPLARNEKRLGRVSSCFHIKCS